MNELYTIGHSTRTVEEFSALLRENSVQAVCDVRSQPYSKINPPFCKSSIETELKKQNFKYVFLGKELGVRSDNRALYKNGKVQYSLLAQTGLFRTGITRLLEGAAEYRIALMCAEKDPIMCHRSILICRYLRQEDDLNIRHILGPGQIETQSGLEERLLNLYKLSGNDLFMTQEDRIAKAYDLQSEKIAYTINEDSNEDK